MNLQIPSLEQLIHELSRLPGVGAKTAQRLAYFILRSPQLNQKLSAALQMVEEHIRLCSSCFAYTEEPDLCRLCQSPDRNSEVICVVEEPFDILPIEYSGAFKGLYHVLHGTIAPIDGVGPSDLRIEELLHRINKHKDESRFVKEIVLALDADLEGDTTVLYLNKILHERGIRVTRIAHGVPIGGDIDYIDHRTLGRALENRVEL